MERNLYRIEAACAVYNPCTKELFTVDANSVKKFDVQDTQLLNESTVAKGIKHVFSVDCLGDSLAIKNMSGSIYVYSLTDGCARLNVIMAKTLFIWFKTERCCFQLVCMASFL